MKILEHEEAAINLGTLGQAEVLAPGAPRPMHLAAETSTGLILASATSKEVCDVVQKAAV